MVQAALESGAMRSLYQRDHLWFIAVTLILGAFVLTLTRTDAPWAGLIRAFGCHAPVLFGAWRLTQPTSAAIQPLSAHRLLITGLIYFAGLASLGLLLGQFKLLTPLMTLSISALFAACLFRFSRKVAVCPTFSRRPISVQSLVNILLTLLVLAVSWRCLTEPNYEYDVLTYHLTFPARWVQDAAISIIPTWCGDPAPAYAPLSCEVYYTWLMLPMGDDALARCGQLPFWLLLLCAVGALTREMGLRPTASACVTMILASIPAITAQAGTAMVDVAFTAHLLSVVYFGLRLVRRATPGDIVGLTLAVGLWVGTKYMALAYLMTLLPLLLWTKTRCLKSYRMLLIRPAVLISIAAAAWIGGFWYVRNAVVTGNPVYPLQVKFGDTVVLDGPYGRAQMENSIFNIRRQATADGFSQTVRQSLHSNPVPTTLDGEAALAPDFLTAGPLGITGLLFLIGGIVKLRAARSDRGRWILFYLCTTVMMFMFWYGLPFQQPRFAWGPVTLGIVGAAGVLLIHRRAGLIILTIMLILFWREFGVELVEILSVPWGVWIAALVIAAGVHLRRPTLPTALLPLSVVIVTFVGVLVSMVVTPSPRSETFTYPRWRFIGEAWARIDREVHNATIAYVGHNVPYFLLGRKFENRVLYIPARKPCRPHFYDYAAMPEHKRLGPPNTSEPVFDRYIMEPISWLKNLQRFKVDYVFVTPLTANLLVNIRHDIQGFPIERQWLDAVCKTTQDRPAYARREWITPGGTTLYRLSIPSESSLQVNLPSIKRDETDAIARLHHDNPPPGHPIRDYPHARPWIEQHHLRIIRP